MKFSLVLGLVLCLFVVNVYCGDIIKFRGDIALYKDDQCTQVLLAKKHYENPDKDTCTAVKVGGVFKRLVSSGYKRLYFNCQRIMGDQMDPFYGATISLFHESTCSTHKPHATCFARVGACVPIKEGENTVGYVQVSCEHKNDESKVAELDEEDIAEVDSAPAPTPAGCYNIKERGLSNRDCFNDGGFVNEGKCCDPLAMAELDSVQPAEEHHEKHHEHRRNHRHGHANVNVVVHM